MAGTSTAMCHFLLGHRGTPGVSSRRDSVVVDNKMCIWLHDRYSTLGTAQGWTCSALQHTDSVFAVPAATAA